MRILVTGGLGTVGQSLTNELRSRGNFVVACGRRHHHDEKGFSLGSDKQSPQYARCDVGEFRQVERLFDEMGPFDYVYHTAAEFGRWNGEDFYETLWRTNAIGTKNIIRLQEKRDFKLIHFSSSEVYGDWPNIMVENVMDEYAIKQMNDYAMSKWVNEMQIYNSASQYGTKTVVVRLFNTYGPGEYYSPYRSVNVRFLYCALNALPCTVFKGHYRTSTYLGDVIRTLANIVDNFKAGETYNIGGDRLHSIEELSNIILKVSKASKSLVQYKETEVLTTKIKKVDISKAVKDLDHQLTTDLDEGLQLTFDWMKSVYNPS